VEVLRKRCADLENEMSQVKNERDEKARALVALAEELKKEKEMRAKIQSEFQGLEKTLQDLERQINALS